MEQIRNNLWQTQCPLCDAHPIHKVGDINYFSPVYYSSEKVSMLLEPELWKCGICNSAFVQNAVPEETSISLYKQGNTEKRWSSMPFEQSRTSVILKALERFLRKNARVLDIGCGAGDFLDFARNTGCHTFGVEYSLVGLDLVKKKGHIAFSDLKEANGLFEVITAFDLVEHLYNLPQFMEMCLEKLSPNGCLLFLTGDISCFWAQFTGSNWWYVRYPEHIVFPSKKYFELHPKLQLVDWIPTYASPVYQQPMLSAAKAITKALRGGDYSGLPSIGSDHILVILKRKNSL
uniref:class I SAM-dependent methyltransferase n=1 Tax=Trichocoleus desertorum TaxID=1481672 RepID=UPI0025B3C2A7|nr:class I SAM-dependent methyltransferase [Trichocoleus desertorum]